MPPKCPANNPSDLLDMLYDVALSRKPLPRIDGKGEPAAVYPTVAEKLKAAELITAVGDKLGVPLWANMSPINIIDDITIVERYMRDDDYHNDYQ